MKRKILAFIMVLCVSASTLGMGATAENESVNANAGGYSQQESNENLLESQHKTAVLSDEDKPDAISEQAFKENNHVSRLYEQENDLYSAVFQNSDDQETLYVFDYPIKYVDENGNVCDKKNNVDDIDPESDYADDYRYVTGENDIKTYFPKELSEESALTLEYGNINIKSAPIQQYTFDLPDQPDGSSDMGEAMQSETEQSDADDKNDDSVQTPDTDVVPTTASSAEVLSERSGHIQRDYVEYENVFGENTTVKYTPEFDGYKENIILSDTPQSNRFSFKINTGGMKLACIDGEYCFTDPHDGMIKATIGELVVYSESEVEDISSVDDITAEAVSTRQSGEYDHHYELSTVAENEEYILTIVADREYLESENTAYPIVIDPSITIKNGDTEGTTTVTDTMLAKGKPSENYRQMEQLYIGNYNQRYPNGTKYGRCRVLVGFPTIKSIITSKGISYSNITAAKLYMRDVGAQSDEVTVKAYKVTDNWSVLNANANNAWDLRGTLLSSQVIKANNGKNSDGSINYWYNWNLLPVIKDAASTGSMKGTMLCAASTSDKAKVFASSNYSNKSYRPYLSLTYEIKVSSISLSKTNLELTVTDSVTLKTAVAPSNATNKTVEYESTNPSVVSVHIDGVLWANSPGETTIRAKACDGSGKTAECKVKVYDSLYKNCVYSVTCASNSKNLDVVGHSTASGASVCVYTPNNESNQIWSFQIYTNVSTYKIYPQHTNKEEHPNDLVLGLDSNNKVACLNDSESDKNIWVIHRVSGNKFKISSKYNPNLYLNIDSSNNVIASSSGAEWNINEYNNDTYWNGAYVGVSDMTKATYTIDSSALGQGISLDTYKNAIEKWNNRSANVWLKYDADGTPGVGNCLFKVENGSDILNEENTSYGSILGKMEPNTQDASGITSIDINFNWKSATVLININEIKNMPEERLKAVITHEVGHALKMCHCTEVDPALNTARQTDNKRTFPAIMQPITGNVNGLTRDRAVLKENSWILTHFDTSALISKWGGKK